MGEMSGDLSSTEDDRYCYNCGELIRASVNFCPECGADQVDSPAESVDDRTDVTSARRRDKEQAQRQQSDKKERPAGDLTTSSDPNMEADPDLPVTWLGIKIRNPTIPYWGIYGGVILALLGAAEPSLILFGYLIVAIAVHIDAKYVRTVCKRWKPSKWYPVGAILLMIVFVPLYLYRRSKYVESLD